LGKQKYKINLLRYLEFYTPTCPDIVSTEGSPKESVVTFGKTSPRDMILLIPILRRIFEQYIVGNLTSYVVGLKTITLVIISCILISCTSAPRYHYSTNKNISSKSGSNAALLIKGVKHTSIFTASYYGDNDGFNGQKTANGEIFNKDSFTAAHKSLPFGTILKVTYPVTGKSVEVKINDRGPFVKGRDIDLSYGAAAKIGLVKDGVGKVKVTVIKWGDGETKKRSEAGER